MKLTWGDRLKFNKLKLRNLTLYRALVSTKKIRRTLCRYLTRTWSMKSNLILKHEQPRLLRTIKWETSTTCFKENPSRSLRTRPLRTRTNPLMTVWTWRTTMWTTLIRKWMLIPHLLKASERPRRTRWMSKASWALNLQLKARRVSTRRKVTTRRIRDYNRLTTSCQSSRHWWPAISYLFRAKPLRAKSRPIICLSRISSRLLLANQVVWQSLSRVLVASQAKAGCRGRVRGRLLWFQMMRSLKGRLWTCLRKWLLNHNFMFYKTSTAN